MRISLLCATLGERIPELARLIKSLNLQDYKDFELIVVSQDNHGDVARALELAHFTYQHVRSTTVGISAGRNAGLPFVTGDILMLTDDDCWYLGATLGVVVSYFAELGGAGVLCFRHMDPQTGSTYRHYPSKAKPMLSYIDLLSLASIDICFNLARCREDIRFDEEFGVGTRYGMGEESILLTSLMKKGLRIGYYQEVLAFHPTKNPNKRLTVRDCTGRAALFRRLYGGLLGFAAFMAFWAKNAFRFDTPMQSLWCGLREYVACGSSVARRG